MDGEEDEIKDRFIRIERDEDFELPDGETIESWCCGDFTYDSLQDAKDGTDELYGQKLEWWESEEDYWMAENPEYDWGDDEEDEDEEEVA